jgi:hypothetical protein
MTPPEHPDEAALEPERASMVQARADQAMPELVAALDPPTAERELSSRLAGVIGDGVLRLEGLAVARHKPGRRCLVRYDAVVEFPDGSTSPMPMLGKVRVHRYGKSGLRRLRAFREAGFDDEAPDRIAMPEPLGHVPAFHMWLQRVVTGRPLTEVLTGPDGPSSAARAAEAAVKMHRAGVPADKDHTVGDELAILHERLGAAAEVRPDLGVRIERVAASCTVRAASLVHRPNCGIHRDFYADQILVGAQGWINVVDLDLYCWGDPAVDIGNLRGHVIEQALRETGDARALRAVEHAFVRRFLDLAGSDHGEAVDVYTDLTLARHIGLSTTIEGRGHTTDALVALCEERFLLG